MLGSNIDPPPQTKLPMNHIIKTKFYQLHDQFRQKRNIQIIKKIFFLKKLHTILIPLFNFIHNFSSHISKFTILISQFLK
jgi:hypothetical protein